MTKRKRAKANLDLEEFLDVKEVHSEDIVDLGSSPNFAQFISQARVISNANEWGSPFLAKAAEKFGVDNKQVDLMYIEHKLVHANKNKNRDRFLKKYLKAAEFTPVLKPLNWEHSEPNIGVVFGSTYVESTSPTEQDHLLVAVAVHKYKYPVQAAEIEKRHKEGRLFFSMETLFKTAECSACNEMFDGPEDSYCEHLKARFEPESGTSRILHDLIFIGDAVVENPADSMAHSVSIAANILSKLNLGDNKEVKEIMAEKLYTKAELDEEVAKRVKDSTSEANLLKLEEKNGELVNKVTDLESRLSELQNQLTALNDEKEGYRVKLDEQKSQFDTLSTEKSALESEYANFKTKIENEALSRKRISTLVEAGYSELPKEDSEEYASFVEKIVAMTEEGFDLAVKLGSMKKVEPKAEAKKESKASADDSKEKVIPLTSADDESKDKYAEFKETVMAAIRGQKKN